MQNDKLQDGLFIAFNKGKNPLGLLIAGWTLGPYAHCELIVDGVSFSSGGTDGGVREKDVIYNSKDWDIWEISEIDKNKVLAFYDLTEKHKYDYKGIIFSQLFWWINAHNKDKWFCSEWCLQALDYATKYELPWKKGLLRKKGYNKFSPNRLKDYLQDIKLLGKKVL